MGTTGELSILSGTGEAMLTERVGPKARAGGKVRLTPVARSAPRG